MSRILLALVVGLPSAVMAQPAFPGAEGFGAGATGGRGGSVHIVTTLDPTGPGSVQEALNASGPRIIVFEVSGVIEGDIHIPSGDVTIAGQTAPGAGITIHGHLYTTYDDPYGNFIIRHIRVRPPGASAEWPGAQHDAIQFSQNRNVILDHISTSYGVDETIDMWNAAQRVTIQWSAITFSSTDGHPEGDHNKGMINGPGGGQISIHHNFWAHHRNRTPALADGPAEVVNNVVYNGREGFVHHNPANGDFNIIGNWYVDGPSASLAPLWIDPENDSPPTRYYVWDNYAEDPGTFDARFDNPFTTAGFSDAYTFSCCGIVESQFQSTAFAFSGPGYVGVTVDPTAEARDDVVDAAGAWPRDIVDQWAVEDFASRGGTWGARYPGDFLEGLTPSAAPADTDRDGMADDWESDNGLDPSDGSDHDTVMPSGYTAIEEYINEVADALVGGVMPPRPDGGMDADAGASDGGVDAGPGSDAAGSDAGADGGGADGGGSDAGSGGGGGCAVGSAAHGMWVVAGLLLWRRRALL